MGQLVSNIPPHSTTVIHGGPSSQPGDFTDLVFYWVAAFFRSLHLQQRPQNCSLYYIQSHTRHGIIDIDSVVALSSLQWLQSTIKIRCTDDSTNASQFTL
ncbi:hypothetical protein TIFTF001_008540 [Ficus carica]|uniref:Uncharacterized protein n=1 Tax=Ficus carica TaxID=3494 RepID=A0AA87ZLK8_FICCA|nr:hypothetical protein TIFTF001_008540 [Ficus carica]